MGQKEEKPITAETWRRHARRNFLFLLLPISNFWLIIRHRPPYPRGFFIALIIVNVWSVAMLTWNCLTSLKWYIAMRDGEQRLRELIEELMNEMNHDHWYRRR